MLARAALAGSSLRDVDVQGLGREPQVWPERVIHRAPVLRLAAHQEGSQVLVVLDQEPELGHQPGSILKLTQAVGLQHALDGRLVLSCLHQRAFFLSAPVCGPPATHGYPGARGRRAPGRGARGRRDERFALSGPRIPTSDDRSL